MQFLHNCLRYEYYERRKTKMKTFETPFVEVIKFNVVDVITTSEEEPDEVPTNPCF